MNPDIEIEEFKSFSFPGYEKHYPRNMYFMPKHVKANIKLDFEKRQIDGFVNLTLIAKQNNLKRVEIDSVDLEIKEITVNKIPAEFNVTDKKIVVYLSGSINEGTELSVQINYAGRPKRGLFFIGPDKYYPDKQIQAWTQGEDEDTRYWLPCYDFPNGRSSTELIVTVPAKFTVVSNGKLLEVLEKEGFKKYHYLEEFAHPMYLTSLAIGEFFEIADEVDGVPLQYYVPVKYKNMAKYVFFNTPDMLRFFQRMIGVKYPYAKYSQTVVSDFTFGGMENINATTLTELTVHDKRAHSDYYSEFLISHELSHMWFGDLLTCKDWANGWLNEGFATYFTALYVEHLLGHEEFLYRLYSDEKNYKKEDAENYRRPVVWNEYEDPVELFDSHLYEKGGRVLHMLKDYLGEELFWRAIVHYVSKNQGKSVETNDFKIAVEEVTGINIDQFLEQWIYRAGYPDLMIKHSYDEDRKLLAVTITQTQDPLFTVSMALNVYNADSVLKEKIVITKKQESFYISIPKIPKSLSLDPENVILKNLKHDLGKNELLHILKHAESMMEKIYAASELTKIGDEEVISALKDAVKLSRHWGLTRELAESLGSIKTEAAKNAVIDLVNELVLSTNPIHPKARIGLVKALGEFKDKDAFEMLKKVVNADPSYYVVGEALCSAGKTKFEGAFELLKESLKLESHNDIIRVKIFEGFGVLKNTESIKIAKDYFMLGHLEQVRIATINMLGEIGEGNKDVLEYLYENLNDPMFRVRNTIALAIDKIGDQSSISHLQTQLDRELEGRVKRTIKEAISKLMRGRKESEEFKNLRKEVEQLRDENVKIRERLEKLEKR